MTIRFLRPDVRSNSSFEILLSGSFADDCGAPANSR